MYKDTRWLFQACGRHLILDENMDQYWHSMLHPCWHFFAAQIHFFFKVVKIKLGREYHYQQENLLSADISKEKETAPKSLLKKF